MTTTTSTRYPDEIDYTRTYSTATGPWHVASADGIDRAACGREARWTESSTYGPGYNVATEYARVMRIWNTPTVTRRAFQWPSGMCRDCAWRVFRDSTN